MYSRTFILQCAILVLLTVTKMGRVLSASSSPSSSPATTTIPRLCFSSDKYSGIEGENATLTVINKNGRLDEPLNITLKTTNTTSGEVSFFYTLLSDNFSVANCYNFKLPLKDNGNLDQITQQPEITVSLVEEDTYTVAPMTANSSVFFVDNEIVLLEVTAPSTVIENQGTVDICLEVTGIKGRTCRPIIIYIATIDTNTSTFNAIPGRDFKPLQTIISVPINSQNGDSVCKSITIIDDDEEELQESFEVVIKLTDSNAWVDKNEITITITDDDVCQDGELRLRGGFTILEGRVEICFNQIWGTVCDDLWDNIDASVACRQLGFGSQGAIAFRFAFFGQGTGPIYLDNVGCSGFERRLVDCPANPIGIHDCGHFEDAGVRCMPRASWYVEFEEASYTVGEGDGTVFVPCVRFFYFQNETMSPINVTVSSDFFGSAFRGFDYIPFSSTLTFPTGSENNTVLCSSVTILEDRFVENRENFNVRLFTNGNNVAIHGSSIIPIFILDNDVSISFRDRFTTVNESDGSVSVCLEVLGSFNGTVMNDTFVNVISISRSAIGGIDFREVNETVTFPSGTPVGSVACINVILFDDDLFEKFSRFFYLFITSASSNVQLGNRFSYITILDDEVIYVSFAQSNYSIRQGTTEEVCVELSGAVGDVGVWVNVFSRGGNAIGGVHYSPISETLSFPSNSSSGSMQCVTIRIFGGVDFGRSNLYFQLLITSTERNVFTNISVAQINIIESDADYIVTFDQVSYSVGEEDGNASVPCVQLFGVKNQTTTSPVTVILTSSNSRFRSAFGGFDYVPLNSTTLTFEAGTQNGSVLCSSVTILEDNFVEVTESFIVHLFTEEDNVGIFGTPYATIYILDNDAYVSVRDRFITVTESVGVVTVCLVLSGPFNFNKTVGDIFVDIRSQSFSARAGIDFVEVNETIVFPSGSGSGSLACVNVTIIDDNIFEKFSDSFYLFVTSVRGNAQLLSSFSYITILDDEVISVSFVQSDYSIRDGTTEEVCVELSGGDLSTGVWVTITSRDGTAVAGVDYIRINQILSFPFNSTNGTVRCVSVTVLGRPNFGNRNLYFELRITSTERNVIPRVSVARINITDSGAEYYVGFDQDRYTVREEDGTVFVPCVRLLTVNNLATTSPITVTLTTGNSRSAFDGFDYTSFNSTSLTFNTGSNNDSVLCFSITILEDSFVESTEFFSVLLSTEEDSVGIFGLPTATINILDNDVYVSIRNQFISVNENASVVTVCLELLYFFNRTVGDIFVNVATQDGSAIGGIDFIEINETIVFPSGSTSRSQACVNITLIDDDIFEKFSEFFYLFVNSVQGNAQLLNRFSYINILDDELIYVSFVQSNYSFTEGSRGEVCLELSGAEQVNTNVWVYVVSRDGSAIGGVDYERIFYQIVSFPSNSSEGSIECVTILILPDLDFESGDLYFQLNIISTERNVIPHISVAQINIIESDVDLFVGFDQNSYTVSEGEGLAFVPCVRLYGEINETSSVTVRLTSDNSHGSAIAYSDYIPFNSTLTFYDTDSENDSVLCFSITILDDSIVENTEFFTVHLFTEDDNVQISGIPYASIYIMDNDVPIIVYVTFCDRFIEVNESDSTVTICLKLFGFYPFNETDEDIYLEIASYDGSAIGGVDYDEVNETVVFPSGSGSGSIACINVTIYDDDVFDKFNRFFVVFISSATGNNVRVYGQAFVYIVEDEVIYVSFVQSSYDITEGEEGEVCLKLTGLTEELDVDVWVNVVTQDGTAVGGVDYQSIFYETISFQNGSTNGSIECVTVVTLDNSDVQSSSLFFWLNISYTERNIVPLVSVTRINIIDDDATTVYVTFCENEILADSSTGVAIICLKLFGFSFQTSSNIDVTVVSTDGTAMSGVHYTAVNETVVFSSGSTNGSRAYINVPIVSDGKSNIFFYLQIVSIVGDATVHLGHIRVFIQPPLLYIAFDQDSYTVKEGEGTVSIPCVRLFGVQNVTVSPVWVTVVSNNSGSATGELDYVPLNSTLGFNEGSKNNSLLCFNLTILDDSIFEVKEYLSVHLSSKEDNVRIHGSPYISIFIIDNEVLTFNDNTPKVTGNDIEVSIINVPIVVRSTCTFRGVSLDCTNNSVTFTSSDTTRAMIEVEILLIDGSIVKFDRYVRIDSSTCDLHLINKGIVRGEDGSIRVNWEGTAPVTSTLFYLCTLGGNYRPCTPELTVTSTEIANSIGELIIQTFPIPFGRVCTFFNRRTVNFNTLTFT